MLKTKLFLLLFLTGALAADKVEAGDVVGQVEKVNDNNDYSDCVEKLVEGEKYYIKIEGPKKSYYSYLFGNRVEADKRKVALEARHSSRDNSLLLTTPATYDIQEFTYQDETLFAEMKPETEIVKYYVGLIGKSLHVSRKADDLTSRRVVLKNKGLSFGPEGSEIEPTIAKSKVVDKVCLVRKETATEDYVALVKKWIIENLKTNDNRLFGNWRSSRETLFNKVFSTPILQRVMEVKIKQQLLTSLEVPFSQDKTNHATKAGNNLLSAFQTQMKAVESSGEIDKIIEEKELKCSKDEILERHFLNYTPYVEDDKVRRREENRKFDKDTFTKSVLFPKLSKKFEKIIHTVEANQGENNTLGFESARTDNYDAEEKGEVETKDEVKDKDDVKDLKNGVKVIGAEVEEGVEDLKVGAEEEKFVEGNSGKKSVAVASALAAILFFL